MAQETLLTAARRLVRFLNIDLQRGGLITEETEKAITTLDKQVHRWTSGLEVECPGCKRKLVVPMEERPDLQ
jgi:hypothetical protein